MALFVPWLADEGRKKCTLIYLLALILSAVLLFGSHGLVSGL